MTVCGVLSLFVQVTLVPAETDRLAGEKANPEIVTAAVPVGDGVGEGVLDIGLLELLLAQETATAISVITINAFIKERIIGLDIATSQSLFSVPVTIYLWTMFLHVAVLY